MATLARSSHEQLRALIATAGDTPSYHMPRPPESGLCQVRGLMGGNGQPFNLGEMTITRCVVQLGDNTTGIAYIGGRDKRRAELAAVADALLLNGSLSPTQLKPLRERIDQQRQSRADRVSATKVDFFTLVRGDD